MRFSDPGCRASASVLDPGSFGLLLSITFLQKLRGFQSLFVLGACGVCFMEIRSLILPLSLASPSLSQLKLSVFVLSPTSYRLFVSDNCPNESFDSPTGSDDEVIINHMPHAICHWFSTIWSSKDRACGYAHSLTMQMQYISSIVFNQLAGLQQ